MMKYDEDGNLLPRKLDFSILPSAKIESSQKQSNSVLDSQSLREDQREEDLNLPDMQLRLGPSPVKPSQASVTEVSIQDVPPPRKTLAHRFDHQLGTCQVSKQDPVTSRGQIEAELNYNSPNKQRHCNCKVSKCLKQYCECFASGSYCKGCNCLNCHNNLENETSRQEAITVIIRRNPVAFKPKIVDSPHKMKDLQGNVRQIQMHRRGCNCKKTECQNKYCECYQADVFCSENCRCQDCKNFEGSKERKALPTGPRVSETYIQQTTNATVKRPIDMSDHLNSPQSRKGKSKDSSHSVAAKGSPVVQVVHNQRLNDAIRNGDTSLFSLPNNKAVSGSITCTYRSSPSSTILPQHVRELCSLLVVKAADVTEKFSAQRDVNEINDTSDCIVDANRMDWKPSFPATRALMCDEEHEIVSEKETSARVTTSQEKEDADTSSEIYLEQERRILSSFRDCLLQLATSGSLNARNIKTNTDLSQKEPGD